MGDIQECPVCKDEGIIQNPDGELICLECGWTSSGISMSRRAMIQAQHGYQEAN